MLAGARRVESGLSYCYVVVLGAAGLIGCGGSDSTGSGGAAATGGTNASTSSKAAATSASASTTQAATSSGTGSAAFPCAGMPLPTTAPPMVKIGGKTMTFAGTSQTPLPNVALEVFAAGNPTPIATTNSDAMGVYSVSLATGGMPLDGYVHAAPSGDMETYLYPPSPLAADQANATMLIINSGTFDLLNTFASGGQTAGNGFLGIVLSDCNGMPVPGATVTTVPAGTVRYNAGGIPSNNSMATDTDGVAYVFNVPPGDVMVQASAQGTTLRAHTVTVRPDVVTTTAILP